MKSFYVYILASGRDGTLYIGVTNDLLRRVAEHKSGQIEGFTKKYKVDYLVPNWKQKLTNVERGKRIIEHEHQLANLYN